MAIYETIGGKWHEFVEGKEPRPLSDIEAAAVIWGSDAEKWREMAVKLAGMLRIIGNRCEAMYLECNLCINEDGSTAEECPIKAALARFDGGEEEG